jgi:superoxide dismutase, Fe-Mn family
MTYMPKHSLPKLSYSFDALEPYMDAKTVEVHYGKHHQIYVDKLNAALEKHPALFDTPIELLIAGLNVVPEDIRTAVRNAGGGHVNHTFFWSILAPQAGGFLNGKFADALTKRFGSFDSFRKQFTEMSLAFFGSGWVWLVVDKVGTLEITCTANQDSPLSLGKKPLLVIDLWEHAYYLKYQNRRAEFVEAFWNLVNWRAVERYYTAALVG